MRLDRLSRDQGPNHTRRNVRAVVVTSPLGRLRFGASPELTAHQDRDDQPGADQHDVDQSELRGAERQHGRPMNTVPDDNTSPALTTKLSVTCFALYFSSRVVGRNSICFTVF